MVKKAFPGRKRRASGYVFVSLAAMALGYSVWAAQLPTAPANGTSATPHPRILSWPNGEELAKFYPAGAKHRGVPGMAYIAVTLDRTGRPTDTRILSVTPQDMGFSAAASTMVHFMTFSNPTSHPVVVKFHVKFVLQRGARTHHHVSARNRAT